MADGQLAVCGVGNGVNVYYNCRDAEAAAEFAGKTYYLGRFATSGVVSKKGKNAGIPFVLVLESRHGATTGMTDAKLWREHQTYPRIGMYESAHCFFQMQEAERTITDLKLIPNYGEAMQHLAANAATRPILRSLVHLSDLVVESMRRGLAMLRRQEQGRKWTTVKEGLFRKHTHVGRCVEDLLRVAGGDSQLQHIRARGTRSEFLAREGTPGPDGRLFEPKLDFGSFLHDSPNSLFVCVTPSMVNKLAPDMMTPQQWLAICRLHLRADIMSTICASPADTFESTATVGFLEKDGAERIFLPHPPALDHPITKDDAMWMIEHKPSSSAAAAVALCNMPLDSRQADSGDLGAPSLEGNLYLVQSVSQDKFSLRSTPATLGGGNEVTLKGLGSVRRHRWEYGAMAAVAVALSPPFSVLAGFPVTPTQPFAPKGMDLGKSCSNAKLTHDQELEYRRAASTTHPVINLTSPAGAGKSRTSLALLQLWLADILLEGDTRKIACYAVSKPLLREPMLTKVMDIFGPELARHVVIAGMRDENFEYLNDAIKQATEKKTSNTLAEMRALDIEIAATLVSVVTLDMLDDIEVFLRIMLDLHARRSQAFWRWVSESKEASAAFTADIKIVIMTTGKLLKEMAPGDGGILSERDVDVVVLDEAQQERTFTVLAIAANTSRRIILAQDHRQRFVTSFTHYEENAARTDETRGGAPIAGGQRGCQGTVISLKHFLEREEVMQLNLTVVIRQGWGAINFLQVLSPAKYGDLQSSAAHETFVHVIPFSTPSEWVVVAEDLPESIRRREGDKQRVYRNQTLYLAIGALVERSIRDAKSVMVIVYTDRMRQGIVGYLREFLKVRGCSWVGVEVAGTPSDKLVIVTSPVGSGGVDVDVVVGVLGARRYNLEAEFSGQVLNDELRYIMVTRGKHKIYLFLEVFQASERPTDATHHAASRALPLDRVLAEYTGWKQYPSTADLATHQLLDDTEPGWENFKTRVELEARDCWHDGVQAYNACDWCAIAANIRPMAEETISGYFARPNAFASYLNSGESALPNRRKRKLEEDFRLWTSNSCDFIVPDRRDQLAEWCRLVVPHIKVSIKSANTLFFSVQLVARLIGMRCGKIPIPLADRTHPMRDIEPEKFQYEVMGALAAKQKFACGRSVRRHKVSDQELNEMGPVFFYKMCRSERAKTSVRYTEESKDYLIESHHGMGLERMHHDIYSFVCIARDFDVFSDFVSVLCEFGAALKDNAVEFDSNGEHKEHAQKLLASLRERGITCRGH